MDANEPATAYSSQSLQGLKNRLIAAIDTSTDEHALQRCWNLLNGGAPCVYTDEELAEELRLSEASGYVTHDHALQEFAKWGFVR